MRPPHDTEDVPSLALFSEFSSSTLDAGISYVADIAK